MAAEQNRYGRVIERLFLDRYVPGSDVLVVQREELIGVCQALGVLVPKNLGDIVYSFRYRIPLPDAVLERCPPGRQWIIMPAGTGVYRFEAVRNAHLVPATNRHVIKIQDATPGIIAKGAQSDEQGLLARLRYNRLIDTFLHLTCYSLQNHLRTTVRGMGQIEVDELYLGVDRHGAQYVVPVQAKGGRDSHSAVQIRQDIALCGEKFGNFVARPVGAQFMPDNVIALMEFQFVDGEVVVVNEQHYRLVGPDGISSEELRQYREQVRLSDA